MYIDRITEPAVSTSAKQFQCPKKHILGVRIIYQKEKRPAFRLFVDAVQKKIVRV